MIYAGWTLSWRGLVLVVVREDGRRLSLGEAHRSGPRSWTAIALDPSSGAVGLEDSASRPTAAKALVERYVRALGGLIEPSMRGSRCASPRRDRVVQVVARARDGITASQLAERLGMSRLAASVQLHRAAAAGLIGHNGVHGRGSLYFPLESR